MDENKLQIFSNYIKTDFNILNKIAEQMKKSSLPLLHKGRLDSQSINPLVVDWQIMSN